MDCVFGVVAEKATQYSRSSRFSPMLPTRNFIGFHFTFRCVIHSVNFCKGFKVCVYIHIFACACLAVPASFVEKTIFAPFYCLLVLCQISDGCIYEGLFLFFSRKTMYFY